MSRPPAARPPENREPTDRASVLESLRADLATARSERDEWERTFNKAADSLDHAAKVASRAPMALMDIKLIGGFINDIDTADLCSIEDGATALQALVNLKWFVDLVASLQEGTTDDD